MTDHVRRWRKGEGLTELISRRINNMIVDRQLSPGDPLPTEAELLQTFDVGRSVIREAIVRLRALGVVDVRHGRGMFVADLPVGLLQARLRRAMEDQRQQAPRHAEELRQVLLEAAARLAVQQGADIESCVRALRGISEVPQERISEALETFYACLGQCCGNPLIEQLLAGAALVMRKHDQERWKSPPDRARLVTCLGEMVTAVREGRAEAAVAALRVHFAQPV